MGVRNGETDVLTGRALSKIPLFLSLQFLSMYLNINPL